MKTLHFFLLIPLSFSLADSVFAQEKEFTPGLNYTTLSAPKIKPAAPAAEAAQSPTLPAATPEQTQEEEQDPATRVWNKYKALATGETAEAEDSAKNAPQKPITPAVAQPDKPTKPTANTKQEKPTTSGMGAILEEWKNSKTNQREMRSKSFKVPKSIQEKQSTQEENGTP